MEQETKTPMIYGAMHKALSMVKAIGKDHENAHFKFKFRSIDDVINMLNPVLSECGLFIAPQVISEREERLERGVHRLITVEYRFYATDGSHVSSVVVGEAADTSDKSANKALSAAFKYAVFQTFCIPVEAEDADKESPDVVRPQRPPTREPEPAPARVANAGQVGLIWSAVRRAGIPEEEFRDFLKNSIGVESTKNIPAVAVDAVIRWANDRGRVQTNN